MIENIYAANRPTKRRLNRTNIDNTAASRTIAESGFSGAENVMRKSLHEIIRWLIGGRLKIA